MHDLVIRNARIVTPPDVAEPLRGDALGSLGVIERGHVAIDGDRITKVEAGPPATGAHQVVDLGGRVLLPAWVDCHTHACWAGSRVEEWARRLAGATYLELLEAGGGIMSTVRAVRDAGVDRLASELRRQLARMSLLGTGAVEVKSGYGLTTGSELKMLEAIAQVAGNAGQPIVSTFLGAHAIDPEQPDFVDRMIEETLPAVAEAHPGITADAYVEQGAWSLADARRYFERAVELGCGVRVHADQFNSLGAVAMAIELGAISVDHLEASTDDDLVRLAASDTMGVMLPVCGFHLDDRYGDGRRFVDAGGALAIATNCNPGSAPSPSMPFAIALACRRLGLRPAEAIVAATLNAACVLGLGETAGVIAPGRRADLQGLDVEDESAVAFEVAGAGPALVVHGGVIVRDLHPPSTMLV